MKLTICIGSACHLKGSHQVIAQLQELIQAHGVGEQVQLAGSFCRGHCQDDGVCVTLDDAFYALKPEDTQRFFTDEVLAKL
ncbi:MAG: (2Fe-2S) ferredoxin domain-containing protein [Christensenellales bacterium]|jgi:NADH:ubiquinone oxidoreductase subunit E